MSLITSKTLDADQKKALLSVLERRFNANMHRHQAITWSEVVKRLENNPDKLWSLDEMESTGGEPDVVVLDSSRNSFVFCDCSPETPKGRVSLCYDRAALDARKEHKPANSAMDLAEEMGIELLDEEEYRNLQNFGPFDQKTSSWIKTPVSVRELGGAIFGDYRFGRVFIYHNGASSYYAARSFRGKLEF